MSRALREFLSDRTVQTQVTILGVLVTIWVGVYVYAALGLTHA